MRTTYRSAWNIVRGVKLYPAPCVGGAQKCVDRGREINLTAAVNKDTLTRGLRYSIATGNWGMQGTAGLRAGVSQVLRLPRRAGSRAGIRWCMGRFPFPPSRQAAGAWRQVAAIDVGFPVQTLSAYLADLGGCLLAQAAS